ncbi:hypothetical protein OTU49_009729 [Cherax quadricarinatus]|uniref:Uncharacterized protein n=1 Tax=Cherax quadricarinatus TaxID=27406 RepID=A0AAW0WHK1_CHEQU
MASRIAFLERYESNTSQKIYQDHTYFGIAPELTWEQYTGRYTSSGAQCGTAEGHNTADWLSEAVLMAAPQDDMQDQASFTTINMPQQQLELNSGTGFSLRRVINACSSVITSLINIPSRVYGAIRRDKTRLLPR